MVKRLLLDLACVTAQIASLRMLLIQRMSLLIFKPGEKRKHQELSFIKEPAFFTVL